MILAVNNSMNAIDLSGSVKWSVPGFTPVMATADGGVIAWGPSGYVTFDQNGVQTGMLAELPTQSWTGKEYELGSIDQVAVLPINFAPSYLAMPGGNQSGNGTAIWQVLSPAPPSSSPQKQLPPQGAALNSNYNSIEILTTVSPDTIFSKYIQTFAGAGNPPAGTANPNTEVTIINAPPPPITATGQNITFRLDDFLNYTFCAINGLPCPMQGPFSVQSERFDTTAHTISAVTLTGHPLAGWRYWRVYSVGTNDVVVETGAVDTSYGGLLHPLNYAGYYLTKGIQLKTWEDDLRYIFNQIKANDDPHAVEGTTPQYNIVKGEWNQAVPGSPSQTDILENVCQSSTCN